MSNLVPTTIFDKNGVRTTRHKKLSGAPTSSRISDAPSTPPIGHKEAQFRSQQFGFDRDDIEPFLYGDCHRMAAYLRDAYGLPTVTVMVGFSGDDDLVDQEFTHILNELPDGMLVDASGVYTPDEILGIWGGDELVPGDEHIEMSQPQFLDEPDIIGDAMMARLGIARSPISSWTNPTQLLLRRCGRLALLLPLAARRLSSLRHMDR